MKRLILLFALAGCQAPKHFDYNPYLEHFPRSILVLPPLDESPEADASIGWLSTATLPLAEHGYYVFPIGLVDRILRENGLPTPGEMHQVSLAKLDEVFGADSVLYVTIKRWGTSYQVIQSSTQVEVDARLVDIKTGTLLWSGSGAAARNSGGGGDGIFGMLTSALVSQVVTTMFDPTREVARAANKGLLGLPHGMLLGPYHPEQEEGLAAARELGAE